MCKIKIHLFLYTVKMQNTLLLFSGNNVINRVVPSISFFFCVCQKQKNIFLIILLTSCYCCSKRKKELKETTYILICFSQLKYVSLQLFISFILFPFISSFAPRPAPLLYWALYGTMLSTSLYGGILACQPPISSAYR